MEFMAKDKEGNPVEIHMTVDGKYAKYFPNTHEYSPAFIFEKGLKKFLKMKQSVIIEN